MNKDCTMDLTLPHLDYQPRFPKTYRPGVAIIGSGGIVRKAHLPAYKKYDVNVTGIYDISPEATRLAQEAHGVAIYASLEALLADPRVEVVDIATHPTTRTPLIQQALAAGKHVLSQKPFALDIQTARELTLEAEQRGLILAVNQNGRWSPAWRVATLLIQKGVIGQVLAVTHMFEFNAKWVKGTIFDTIPHWAIYDYAIHWVDATRCWLEDSTLTTVRARNYRTPNQPVDCQSSLGTWIEFAYANGAHAMIRGINCTDTRRLGHPFWIHGEQGTIRGSTLGNDFLELEHNGLFIRYDLKGQWFPDGFAGAMGELLCAIDEKRVPYNSARHNLLSLQMTLAACSSADQDGLPVSIIEEDL